MESLEYIDNYFNGELSADEVRQFEQKIADDPAFAEEVADYLSMLQAATEQLREEKKKGFREIYQQNKPAKTVSIVRKLWPSVAVAALLAGIFFGWQLFNKPVSSEQLADRYVHEKLQKLPVQMAVNDTNSVKYRMQEGTDLFNKDNLSGALDYFERIAKSDSTNYEAKQNAGISALRLGKYDMALDYFNQLESYTLQSNPAKLYLAITHMKRNLPGDKEQAKKLLQEVIDQDLEGKDDAKELLKQL